ncbi:MAG: 1-acyl-sn-glycerol-3-phosphate acyltransferase [Desulfobulbaceae bacterium]
MHKIQYTNGAYRSQDQKGPFLARLYPSLVFYFHLFWIVFRASRHAQRGEYDGTNWLESSNEVLQKLENAGICVDISGIENIARENGPVVIVGNHMSMMETLLLPVMLQPIRNVTFVVKESLLSYPIFKHVMCSRNPIAVTRTNPRQDFQTVMNEGVDRLGKGTSIIVFPQTTRSHSFDPKQMSSIAVKLAKKAKVPIVPLALKTDGWRNGKRFKDFGKFDVDKTAYFSFGQPMMVEGKGDKEQATVNAFIEAKMTEWQA